MAYTAKQMGFCVGFCGTLSCVFGITAELMKPAVGGIAITGNGGVICNYPKHYVIPLAYSSIAFLFLTAVFGSHSPFQPYKERSIPKSIFFRITTFRVYYNLAILTSLLAVASMGWATIREQLYLSSNIQNKDENTKCQTIMPGLFGGFALISLASTLFWLVSLMLAINIQDDFCDTN